MTKIILILFLILSLLFLYYTRYYEKFTDTPTDITTAKIQDLVSGDRINIIHRRLYYQYYDKDIEISAIVTNETLLSKLTLYYKNINDDKWLSVDLVKSNNMFRTFIPRETIYSMGLKYYLYIEDIMQNISYFGQNGLVTIKPEPILINIIDLEPPVIKHTPIMKAYNQDTITFSAVVFDNIAVDRVSLHIKDGRSQAFRTYLMEFLYDDKYEYNYFVENQTELNYYITAVDKYVNRVKFGQNGLVRDSVSFFTIECIDLIPPVIHHTPLISAKESVNITVNSIVTDNIEVKDVFLHYRKIGVSTFKKVLKERTGLNEYQGNIPRFDVTKPGIEYYISAVDINDNVSYYVSTGNFNELNIDDIITVNIPHHTIIEIEKEVVETISPIITDDDKMVDDFDKVDIDEIVPAEEPSVKVITDEVVEIDDEVIVEKVAEDDEEVIVKKIIEDDEKIEVKEKIVLEYQNKIVTGANHTLFLMDDGTLWTWGENIHGQLGEGSNVNSNVPVKVFLNDVVDVQAGRNHTVALLKDGTVWTWGNNSSGQLGIGSNKVYNEPVKVKGLSNIVMIASGFMHNFAIDKDDNLWGWGNNVLGQLGDGTNINRLEPVIIKEITDVKFIAGGFGHTIIQTKNGNVWCWGNNSSGQLGLGHFNNTNKPVLNTNISNVKMIVAGREHTIALLNDGTVWSWGDNRLGQLGIEDIRQTNLPLHIPRLNDVKKISTYSFHNLALTLNNKIYGWGNNFSSQLSGTVSNISEIFDYELLIQQVESQDKYIYSPVEIEGLKNIISISTGFSYSVFLDNQKNLWFLGDNRSGQFGNKSVVSSVRPIQLILN